MKLRITILIALTVLLSACQTVTQKYEDFRDRHEPYRQTANSVAPLQVPPGLSSKKVMNYYPIPPLPLQRPQTLSLIPPGSRIREYQQQPVVNGVPQPQPRKNIPQARRILPVRAHVATVNNFVINGNFEQAWNKVGKALNTAHYQLLDQDLQDGNYIILDTAQTDGRVTNDTPTYYIHLSQQKNNVRVTLLDPQGVPVSPTIARRILTAIKKYVS